MTTPNLPRSIVLVGRRWFDRVNGNTYHTVEVFEDGEAVHKSPTTYGYDDSYVETAAEWLESQRPAMARERYTSGGLESLRSVCERLNITLGRSRVDVHSRKDL